ncbi:hypothetical protein B0H67DRAFT_495062 [Lasiosphaeris hirsuta]|uniref:F-box domain-containing protein n=1 Tax=Lasiosphaeris hirsuta TaxID=260670 RepID=A0AA40DM88_9PEZI|nr:hypothetical protein B0H67DRAFT_495062 [Lasiosphaeris hirsuta]
MTEVLYSSPAPLQGPDPTFTREQHQVKELSLRRIGARAPRRSQTHEDYELPQAIHAILQQLQTADNSLKTSRAATREPVKQEPKSAETPRRRPPLGPPRRSYSLTDHEPIPHHHRPSAGITLLDLPAELHFAIFDFLDPIDSTCFGLANKHLYSIHRRMCGTVRLSARREGPNELEWAWHVAGAVIQASPTLSVPAAKLGIASTLGAKERSALSKLRIRGQAYCRKCGVTRCELHKHIQDWMGDDVEYCSIKQKFGVVAPQGAKPYCYMSKPGDPNRCGRHWVRKSKVVLK